MSYTTVPWLCLVCWLLSKAFGADKCICKPPKGGDVLQREPTVVGSGFAEGVHDEVKVRDLKRQCTLNSKPHITPIYYSSFHFIFHYPNITPKITLLEPL